MRAVIHTPDQCGAEIGMWWENACMPDRILTLADVAEILGVTVPTARGLVRRGEIQGFQVGGRGIWRVEESELDAYVQRAKSTTAARYRSAATEPNPERSR